MSTSFFSEQSRPSGFISPGLCLCIAQQHATSLHLISSPADPFSFLSTLLILHATLDNSLCVHADARLALCTLLFSARLDTQNFPPRYTVVVSFWPFAASPSRSAAPQMQPSRPFLLLPVIISSLVSEELAHWQQALISGLRPASLRSLARKLLISHSSHFCKYNNEEKVRRERERERERETVREKEMSVRYLI